MNTKTLSQAFAIVIVTSASTFGCNGIRNQCTDFEDNDGDGLIDSNDPGCQSVAEISAARSANCSQQDTGLSGTNPACQVGTGGAKESDDPQCFDRVDNDGDGLIDLDDPGCSSIFDNTEENPECSDGIDNDGDGLIDYQQDPGCAGNMRYNSEANDPQCQDQRDNDGDGLIDFPADLGCTSVSDTSELNPECFDGRDNDGDGRTDFGSDPDCTSLLDTREAAVECGDGVDNDRDGLIDFPEDPGCLGRSDESEINPECSDLRDNDGDGLVDFGGPNPDPGCSSPLDTSEAEPACSDGLDNDGDGLIDMTDPGCDSDVDTSEFDAECRDGADNDGDGLIDFSNDPGCFSLDDTHEGSGEHTCLDNLDNDGDRLIDWPSDPDCPSPTSNAEGAISDCDDGIDNDGDGLIDRTIAGFNEGDPACDGGFAFERLDPVCNDKLDNDGDGRADFAGVDLNGDGLFDRPGEFPPDFGCANANHFRESPEPQCSDGIDNDGDGTADWNGIDVNGDGIFDTAAGELPPDFACSGDPRSQDESDPEQCRDGVDNDGDGLIDFQPQFLPNSGGLNPNYDSRDLDCDNAFDNTEASDA